jgi:hypothetical protein
MYNSFAPMYRLTGKYIRPIQKEIDTNEDVHETAIRRFKEEGYYTPVPSNLDFFLKRNAGRP